MSSSTNGPELCTVKFWKNGKWAFQEAPEPVIVFSKSPKASDVVQKVIENEIATHWQRRVLNELIFKGNSLLNKLVFKGNS